MEDYMKIEEKCSLDQIGSLKYVVLLMFENLLMMEDELLEWIHWLYDYT